MHLFWSCHDESLSPARALRGDNGEMNIKEVKQAITHTVQAYLEKDALGFYTIPTMRQRPVLVMGPPGIGKTQIMAQIAAELDIGLVAYTITHHTRQSAMGLPFIKEQTFGGTTYRVTEYTMSEILASVHRLMEETGRTQGILFLDEINCVSETLAPMMLQFLQCKTFGNQALPQGWVIVAAGNPPEYNKSVRDFDVVTLDRVKRMDVTADYGVWKEYAHRQGIHSAILSYLDLKKEHFYHMESSPEGMQFATARGWEDLSELLFVYERLGIPVNRGVVGQYIQLPSIARDFALYLDLYEKYRKTYQVDGILAGQWSQVTLSELQSAPFDETLAVLSLLLSRLGETAHALHNQQGLTMALHATLRHVKARLEQEQESWLVLLDVAKDRQQAWQRRQSAGQQDQQGHWLLQQEQAILEAYGQQLAKEQPVDAMAALRGWFATQVDALDAATQTAATQFAQAFAFLEDALGASQELVLFVTEITAGYETAWYVETYGCEAYFRHNKELLLEHRHADIRQRIVALKSQQGEVDGTTPQ